MSFPKDVEGSGIEASHSSKPGEAGPSRRSVLVTAALTTVAAGATVASGAGAADAATTASATPATTAVPATPSWPDFGPNVMIFDPTMPASQIQASLDAVALQQVSNEFGLQRYAFLFKPGAYNVDAQLGYYTAISGLGLSPDDVTITGAVRVEGQKLNGVYSALINFWRSAENLSVIPAGGINWWAVSQAAPLRRVHIRGMLFLFPRQGGFSSGGFIADSKSDGLVVNASQQQWLTRDSSVGQWSNAVWNQVFAGVVGAPAQSFPKPPYTTLPTSPLSREKPYLYVDEWGQYNVFAPDLRHDGVGTTWADGPTAGTSISIDDFFIAKPTDPLHVINDALDSGKHLIITPGVYHLKGSIRIERPDTIVLGLGFATLIPDNGIVPMRVADVKGVRISGVIFEAGTDESPVLLQVGDHEHGNHRGSSGDWSDPEDPTSLQDVFFRIGGAGPGKAAVSLIVNSDNVILDNIWAWRADHGSGVGWTVNTADNGVIINGDNVLATGLFVEHYQKYQLTWNGENGRTIMFQNEMPYDPPNQAAWSHDGILGFAAYKVSDWVQAHEGWGLGSYCYFPVDPTIHAAHGFEVPTGPGIKLHDILTVSLGGVGVIDNVVNDFGGPAQGTATVPVDVVSYP